MYLRVAFLNHIHAANVCEKFVNCERIFCMNPAKAIFETFLRDGIKRMWAFLSA